MGVEKSEYIGNLKILKYCILLFIIIYDCFLYFKV